MRTATLRTPGLIAVLLALVATLTSCGTGPGQINSAVIIGDRSISVDEVQALVDKVVREQPAAGSLARERKLDLVAREAVTQLALHELVTDFAEREGITADPDEVAAFLDQSQLGQELPADGSVPPEQLVPQLVYRARDAEEYGTDQVLLAMVAQEVLGRASVTYNLVALPDAATANTLAERIVADPDQSGELMTDAAGDTAQAQLEQPSGPGVNAIVVTGPEGSVFVIPAGQGDQGGGFQVVHVLSREVSGQVDPGFDPSSVRSEDLPLLGRFALREEAVTTGLEVSPRYGVWNDFTVGVVPKAEAEVSGTVLFPSDAGRP